MKWLSNFGRIFGGSTLQATFIKLRREPFIQLVGRHLLCLWTCALTDAEVAHFASDGGALREDTGKFYLHTDNLLLM